MSARIRVVHYLNQFFAGFGGEDKASLEPTQLEGPVGPGRPLQDAMCGNAEIVLTVTCGDDYFSEQAGEAAAKIVDLVKGANPGLFIAGPAFNAGRYGNACGALCQLVAQSLDIPTVTGMAEENPGLEYRKYAYIVHTSDNVGGMNAALQGMARLGLKLMRGEDLRSAREEGYFPRGFRKNFYMEKKGAARALDMLQAKIAGQPFESELVLPKFDRVPPAPPVQDLNKATIALVTTGGLVPKGNPDKLDSTRATRYGKYRIDGLDSLQRSSYEANHGGYSTMDVNGDPHRLVPLDALREMERAGRFGNLFSEFYSFAGCSTAYESAARMGREMAQDLKKRGVDAVLLTSS